MTEAKEDPARPLVGEEGERDEGTRAAEQGGAKDDAAGEGREAHTRQLPTMRA